MQILDAHIHLGEDCVFDERQTEKDILDTFQKYGVYGGIVQPYIPKMHIEDTMEIHDRIAAFCKANAGRFYGMMSMNPHFHRKDYEMEAERCLTKLNFVGIKISPIAHAANPSSKDGMMVFEIAEHYHVPVMVHTGSGAPLSSPIQITKPAESFPDVKIVLAHSGMDTDVASAAYLAKKYDNVFLEPSWLNIMNLKMIYKEVGPEKIMFSSDMLENLPVALQKYEMAFLSEHDKNCVYNKTIREVFTKAGFGL